VRNYYRILGVAERADPDDIKHAYRQLVRRFHPDLAGAGDCSRFREVQEAYEVLSDAGRRREHDAGLAASRREVPAPAGHASWLADEVAIDFPSIDSVLDRIRRGFLEPDIYRDQLSAEILLSAREATFGVSVPLEIPVRHICPRCGGRGETWMERCAGCAGSGEARGHWRVRFPVPAGVAHGARFRLNLGDELVPPVTVDVRIVVGS